MINTIKPNDATFRKGNCGTVKSITECINNGQLGDLTIADQTDDSGKETASESSEAATNSNSDLNKSSFDLDSSQSSSYSTENEDCSVMLVSKKDLAIEKNPTKSCLKNGHLKKECLHKENVNFSQNEPFFLQHHSCAVTEVKNDKLKNAFPNTNLEKLERPNNRSSNCDNYLPVNNKTSLNEAKKYNTLDKTSRLNDKNSKMDNKFNLNGNTLNKSIRIFDSASARLEQKSSKFKRNVINEDKIDELDEVKLKETKDKSPNSTVNYQKNESTQLCVKETNQSSPAKEIIIKKKITVEESKIDITIANSDESSKEIGKETVCLSETSSVVDLSNDNLKSDIIAKDACIPIPPPMPQQSLIDTITTPNPILIKSNKFEKKTILANAAKITFIPPQFNSPPETDTNIKPSEYLKKVSKSFTADNFKNMKKTKSTQYKIKGKDEIDQIKRSSSENHLLVNLKKEKLNQSVSSTNVHDDLNEDEGLENELESELNETDLQDDDTEDELIEHQYETSKPTAVELKLQLDKTLIKSNLSRRSSIKVKLSAGIEANLIEDTKEEDYDCSKSEIEIKKKISQSLSSSSSGISSSSSTASSVSNSFSVTEEQLKTIFLKKTPIKKAETKTFNNGKFLKVDF